LLFLVNLAVRLGRSVNTCNAVNRNEFLSLPLLFTGG